MRLVRRLLLLRRTLPRILSTQRTGDDHHFGQTVVIPSRQHHPSQTRIQRQACQVAPQTRQLLSFINRAELLQQQQAIANGFLRRRFDEGELRHITELQIQHAQDHIG